MRLARAIVIAFLASLGLTETVLADLPGEIDVWNIKTKGLWRREFRARELARWRPCARSTMAAFAASRSSSSAATPMATGKRTSAMRSAF